MKKGLYRITILNLENIREFLDAVDACNESIYCMDGDGRLCDLHFDKDRAEVLVRMTEEGSIPRLDTYTCNQQDTAFMLNYMMCRKHTA